MRLYKIVLFIRYYEEEQQSNKENTCYKNQSKLHHSIFSVQYSIFIPLFFLIFTQCNLSKTSFSIWAGFL
jgi:hypothetical protein